MWQLSVTDACRHDDVVVLQGATNRTLGAWADTDLASKLCLVPLFLPGVSKAELTAAMEAHPPLKACVLHAVALVTMWNDQPILNGKLFFEIAEGNSYTLTKV